MSEKTELDVLFPDETVKLGKVEVVMRPLPLDQIKNVMTHFHKVFELMLEHGKSGAKKLTDTKNLEIGLDVIGDALQLLPLCLFKKQANGEVIPLEIPGNRLPIKVAYDLMPLFLEQNVPEDMLGEFKALTNLNVKGKEPKAKG